ncbi:unnamed protein product, partial [Arabidopsis halleri]
QLTLELVDCGSSGAKGCLDQKVLRSSGYKRTVPLAKRWIRPNGYVQKDATLRKGARNGCDASERQPFGPIYRVNVQETRDTLHN